MSRRAKDVTISSLVAGLVMVLTTMSSAVTSASASAAAGEPAGAASSWLFDFGCEKSPVTDGYLPVANTTLYDGSRGYGLDRVTNCRDRGQPDDLRRDFTVANSYGFLVDVPNGDYRVVIVSGDQIASNKTDVSVEGSPPQTMSTTTGSFAELGISVTVTDGQMNFTFSGDGRINAIGIAHISPPTDLQVDVTRLRPSPSVSLAWKPAAGAGRYNIYRKLGGQSEFTRIGASSDNAYTDKAVELGFTYTYAITAVGDSIIESAKSTPVTVDVIDRSVEPPSAPVGLTLEESIKHDTFTLQWQRVKHAREYHVYRANGAEGSFSRIDTMSSTSYTLYIAPSTGCCYDFYYRVVAVNDGGLSGPSNVVHVSWGDGGSRDLVRVVKPDKLNSPRAAGVGAQYFVDRDFTITTLPDALAGQLLIPGANDDKRLTGPADYLEFTLKRDATVYVAFDDRGKDTWWPGWLADQGFQRTDLTIDTTDAHFTVFAKRFAAGDVTLGPTAATSASSSSYFTIVTA
ncbi:fibronectin type III domain-containing protein [Micromonospora sp. SL1-18]|uniref:fibronectin type III domain-containing protein n=1 Tax=Micromonospora sp. SL1-18 TaxID=3399128 RepID=UPI003A4D92F6